MLVPLKPTEERVSRLTSAATIIDVLDHATSEIASVCSSGRQSALNMILGSEPRSRFKNKMSRLTSAATIVDVLDHATSEIASGSKLGIDATIPPRRVPGEGFKRPWPPFIKVDESVRKKVDALFGGTR
jgi:hypothetical protein